MRDFLWSGPNIAHPGCRLVGWKNLCRPRDQGGWGILDLLHFNQALLEKWWWKFMSDPNWCGSKVIQFNYNLSRWNLFPTQTSRVSFFWKWVVSCLQALRGCIGCNVTSSHETLFWKDRWFNCCTPIFLWPDAYRNAQHPNGSVQDLAHLLDDAPFIKEPPSWVHI